MAHIRLACGDDAPSIIAILKEYIDTPHTLQYEVPSVSETVAIVEAIKKNYPILIIEDSDSRVVGYAFARRNLEQMALSWNAELRAFISLSSRGKGFGATVTSVLIDILKLQNVCNVYSLVSEANPRCESLHNKLGFSLCGTLHKTGFKNGRWIDMHYYEKRINDVENPESFIPLSAIDDAKIQEILHKANETIKDK